MKDTTLSKLGGTCSILTGATFVAFTVLALLLPPEQLETCGCPARFLTTTAHNATLFMVAYAILALYSVFAIAAVLAISETVRVAHEGWVRWTSTLAIIGFAVNLISSVQRLALDPAKATAYVQGDAAVKAALTVPGAVGVLDPQNWLRFGAVGLWALVVSLLALRGGRWPKPLAWVGIGLALVYWLIVVGGVAPIPLLIELVAGVGALVLGTIWYIWLGLRLLRAG
jgi:Domain of unknown function (DUF4386)